MNSGHLLDLMILLVFNSLMILLVLLLEEDATKYEFEIYVVLVWYLFPR